MLLIQNKPRLMDLVRARHGGVTGLMDAWSGKFESQPDRATFYEWLQADRFPSSHVNFLRLCACLDADPACLVRVEALNGGSVADSLLHKSLFMVGGRGIRPIDIVGMFGPLKVWPSDAQILDTFGRGWYRHEFNNPGGNAAYRRLRIRFPDQLRPRVLHFAYRAQRATLWRIYGFVDCEHSHARLFNYTGAADGLDGPFPDGVPVETYFGEGACSFCVASLHPFAIEPEDPDPRDRALRFVA